MQLRTNKQKIVGLKYILLHCEHTTVTLYACATGPRHTDIRTENRQNTVIMTIVLMETYTFSQCHKTGAPACENQNQFIIIPVKTQLIM